MIKLIEKQKIIISHFQKGQSQRQIARQMGLNRRTIARYIKDYERKKARLAGSKGNSNQEELIADIVEDPGYDTSSRGKVKLSEEIIDRIKFYLRENEVKRAEGKAKQQKKKIDIYEALKEEEFDISYSTTCNTIRKIHQEAKEAYIRQEYAFGEVCEFDWGEVKLNIAGKNKTIQMSVLPRPGETIAGETFIIIKRLRPFWILMSLSLPRQVEYIKRWSMIMPEYR